MTVDRPSFMMVIDEDGPGRCTLPIFDGALGGAGVSKKRHSADVDPDSSPRVSALGLTMNLITACLGSGILSLPWTVAGASILPAIGLTFVALALNAGTIMILVVAADRSKTYNLGELFKKLPGKWGRPARYVCDATIWVSVFFTLVGYFIVVSDSLEVWEDHWRPLQEKPLKVGFTMLVILPLCFLDQRYLVFSSGLSIISNIYVFGMLLVYSMETTDIPLERCCVLGVGSGSITTFCGLMQAAVVQSCILPMYEELEHRSPRRFACCVLIAFVFIFVLFVAFSCLAYVTFGPGVASNVMQSFPKSPMTDVGQLGMAFAVIGVYPILLTSMITPIKHSEERAYRQHREFSFPSPAISPVHSPPSSPLASPRMPLLWPTPQNQTLSPSSPMTPPPAGSHPWDSAETSSDDSPEAGTRGSGNYGHWFGIRRSFLRRGRSLWILLPLRPSHFATILVVSSTAVVSVFINNLGSVNIMNGAISTFGLLSLAPGLVGIFLLGRWGRAWRWMMGLLIAFGVIISIVGVQFTSNHADELQESCVWDTAC